MTNISLWDRLVPYIHKLQDASTQPLKTLVDAMEAEFYTLKDQILGLYNLLDVDKCPNEFLVYLAKQIGASVEACDPPEITREQIRNTPLWYKLKGSILGFRIYMESLGYSVTIKRLFETSPDGVDVIEEDEAITGFNQRLPGYHMASKINLYLERLPAAQNLHLCGSSTGELTEFMIKRLRQRIEECKPIHLDIYIIIVKNLYDTVTVSDDLMFVGEINDYPTFFCCLFHGKNSQVVDAVYPYFDEVPARLMDSGGYFDDVVGGAGRRVWDSPMGMPQLWDVQKVWDVPEDHPYGIYHQFDRPRAFLDDENIEDKRCRLDAYMKFDTHELDVSKFDTFYCEHGTNQYQYTFFDDREYEVSEPYGKRDGAISLLRDGWTIIDNPDGAWSADFTGTYVIMTLSGALLCDREILYNECVQIPFSSSIVPYLTLRIIDIYDDNTLVTEKPSYTTLPSTLSGIGYKVLHIQSVFHTSTLAHNGSTSWKHNYQIIGKKRDCCGMLDELNIVEI